MPIIDMRFENGMFFAREVGDIDVQDAQEWAARLRSAAESYSSPIVALVDAMDVEFVHAEARDVFVRASHTPNVRVIAVAVASVLAVVTARSIILRGEPGKTYTFVTLAEARSFAKRILDGASVPLN